MSALARLALLLVVVLMSLSAYLRLAHSGIGCAEWPQCYGRIGAPAVDRLALGSGEQRLELRDHLVGQPLALLDLHAGDARRRHRADPVDHPQQHAAMDVAEHIGHVRHHDLGNRRVRVLRRLAVHQ